MHVNYPPTGRDRRFVLCECGNWVCPYTLPEGQTYYWSRENSIVVKAIEDEDRPVSHFDIPHYRIVGV